MAMVKILRNSETGNVVFVPFALDRDLGGGSRATGPMETVSEEQFLAHGVEMINRYLEKYYTRDFRIPSELYQVMEQESPERFLRQHDFVNLVVPKSRDKAKIWIGPELESWEQVRFPFEENFPNDLLRILYAIGH